MILKKDDKVLVICGKDRGKTGKIEKILLNDKVVVSGINIAKKAVKPSKKAPKGGQVEFPAPIHVSNLKYICVNCDKPSRVISVKTDNRKIRVCKLCQNKPVSKKTNQDKK